MLEGLLLYFVIALLLLHLFCLVLVVSGILKVNSVKKVFTKLPFKVKIVLKLAMDSLLILA